MARKYEKVQQLLPKVKQLKDDSIVAYKMGPEQNIKLVPDTIRAAKRKERVTAELQLHSDQGFSIYF